MRARVLVVDDQPLLRAGLRLLLEGEDDLEVVGEAEDGSTAADLAMRLQPDLVLLDLQMPGSDGLVTLRRLRAAGDTAASPRVLVLTVFEDAAAITAALRAGADGYVLKSSPPSRLLAAVRSTAAGDSTVSPEVLRLLVGRTSSVSERWRGQSPLERLTEREAQVLDLLCSGTSDVQIGRELHVETSSVKTYVHRIVRKLGVSTRTQAVLWALEHRPPRRRPGPPHR